MLIFNTDNALMKELEEAEKEAQETAKIIFELKERLAQLLTVRTVKILCMPTLLLQFYIYRLK